MAPPKPRDPSIERTAEYDDFLSTLAAYHEKRGTQLDREPKVGTKHIDLLRLYKRVVEEGGYDKVSDTRNNKLAWRKIAADFLPGSANLTTQAFLVKTAYYKNLAAYEISTIHKREPPPKEILENVSARGGDLLNRTIENYHRPEHREAERLRAVTDGSDDEESDTKTPRGDKMDADDASNTGRVTRALRHAPPQRVLFQPDMNSPRQTRQTTGHVNSPSASGSYYNTSAASMAIANYEPRPAVPSNMKPVVTPSNNPEFFRQLRQKYIVNRKNRLQQPKGMMLPGTGFPGPNIYFRALHALRSREPEEEAYALHHLVKISHERGDKYRFDQFHGLAEALIAKVIEAASIFYDVSFDIVYTEEEMNRPNALNGLEGTRDLIKRLRSLEKVEMEDTLLPESVTKSLEMVTEAGLVIRNMVQLRENAQYIAYIPSVKDVLVIVLNLPRHSAIAELQNYALEIAEQLTRCWILDAEDPVYLSLLAQLETDQDDRGKIITALRALTRISVDLEPTHKMTGVSSKVLRSLCEWLLVEDEDLRNAVLDFLYAYTGFSDNVEALADEVDVESLVVRLVCLLQCGAAPFEEKRPTTKTTRTSQFAESAPKLSEGIISHLATLDEPERSSHWLRTCFEEDPTAEITQIQLWTAYNEAFKEFLAANPGRKPILAAKDFITNVSATIPGSSAQVNTSAMGPPKYTIRGIRPRLIPVDPITKKAYMRCCWHPPSLLNGVADSKHSTRKNECGEFASSSKSMWEHLLSSHLRISKDDNGKWLLERKPDVNMTNGEATSVSKPVKYSCHWGGCTRFPKGTESAYEAGQHIKTHLPDTGAMQFVHARHNRTLSNSHILATSAQVRSENFQPQFSQPVGLGSLGMYGRYPNNGYGNAMDPRYSGPETALPPHQPEPGFKYHNTPTDEAKEPVGVPLAAVLVLRNLARQLAKLSPPDPVHEIPDSPTMAKRSREDSPEYRRSTGAKKPRLSDAAKEMQKDNEEIEKEEREDQAVGWVAKVFDPVKSDLVWVASHNLSLRGYMVSLMHAVAKGGG